MSNRTGRHSYNSAHAIPARQLIASGGFSKQPATAIAAPRHHGAALALATATTLAFTPVIAHQAPPLHLPTLSAPNITLTANPTQIQSLVNAVNAQLDALDAQVADLVGVPGQTLAGALTGAASINTGFWKTLIAGAGKDNPLLVGALKSLQQLTSGGLTELAATVTDANADITLTTGQISTLLTSTLTGSAATAVTAFTGLLANPLSLSSYAALLAAPFTIAGGALTNIITAADHLGANAISLGATIVHGATAQISNIITSVNKLASGVKGAINNQMVDGLITAVQGVVAAPLNAVIAVVNGGTTTVAHAATDVLDVAASAARGVTKLWIGDGTHNGAVQAAIIDIGSNPLSVGSYANAVTALAKAAITTVTGTAATITAGLLPIVPNAAADLVGTAANATTAFSSGVAQIAAGLLTAVGVPPIISNTMYALAGTFNTGVHVVADAVAASLRATAAVLRAGTTLTGLFTPVAATAAAVPSTSKLVALGAAKTAVGSEDSSTSTTDSKPTKPASTAPSSNTTKATTPASKDTTDKDVDKTEKPSTATSSNETKPGASKPAAHAGSTTNASGEDSTTTKPTAGAHEATPAKPSTKPAGARDAAKSDSGSKSQTKTTAGKDGAAKPSTPSGRHAAASSDKTGSSTHK